MAESEVVALRSFKNQLFSYFCLHNQDSLFKLIGIDVSQSLLELLYFVALSNYST